MNEKNNSKNEFSPKSGNRKLEVVARKSPLSLLQVKEFFKVFPELVYHLRTMDSMGDKDKKTSLMDNIPEDFFTHELDRALIEGEADISVHSAKDLPYPMDDRLEVFALLEASDKTDALVSRNHILFSDLPAGSGIGTSSCLRKSEVLKYRQDLKIQPVRGNIEERIQKVDSGEIDALIVATCALKRLGLENRISEILPFKTHPLQGNLAVVGKKGDAYLRNLFGNKDIRKKYGKVTLVGFGPGNPDLLTLGGDKALHKADIIYYDDLIDEDFIRASYPAEKIYVGKRRGKHSRTQEEINELLYRSAVEGRNTVRLKGGDPMIFARGREELDYLQSRMVKVDVIPGISAGIALSAYTHIPLTHRGISSSVAFVTGHKGELSETPDADTLVYYMAGAEISGIAKKLIKQGREKETPVAMVSNVSLKNQKTIFSSLGELQYSVISYPAPVIVIIGKAVAFENNKRQKILMTGTSERDNGKYENYTHLPLIKIDRIRNNKELEKYIREICSFDYVILTSRYGAEFFFSALNEISSGTAGFEKIRFISVGRTTSTVLKKYGILPFYESITESAKGIVDYFESNKISGKKILLPRSDIGIKVLPEKLEALGNEICDVPVYRNTVNIRALERMDKKEISEFSKILFTSPSTVRAFRSLYGNLPVETELIGKGETTEKELKNNI